MRNFITGCGILVALALFIIVHSTIVSDNLRNNEVNSGLYDATDYALDVMGDIYSQMDYDSANESTYLNQLMGEFCRALNEKIGTDGNITVQVIHADLQKGEFDIKVTEKFFYKTLGRTGTSFCEKAVSF